MRQHACVKYLPLAVCWAVCRFILLLLGYAGWQHHPVCNRSYHFIIPSPAASKAGWPGSDKLQLQQQHQPLPQQQQPARGKEQQLQAEGQHKLHCAVPQLDGRGERRVTRSSRGKQPAVIEPRTGQHSQSLDVQQHALPKTEALIKPDGSSAGPGAPLLACYAPSPRYELSSPVNATLYSMQGTAHATTP